MVTAQLLSPAKINLMLRIVGRRDDGFHLLQTCFQLLNWGDQMTFDCQQQAGNGKITVQGMPQVAAANNLISLAADALRPLAQVPSDWVVSVDKRIPMGGGLGGGSSNAATTLKFLNQHWRCGLSPPALLSLAAQLGADVPIFVSGQSALATGIGEVITPRSFDTPHVLLLMPDCQINTAALFGHADLTRDQVPLPEAWLQDSAFWINDFFPLVLQLQPAVKRLYEALKDHMPVRLSGTGSTLFAVFADAADAAKASQLASAHCRAILVRPLAGMTNTDSFA
ncbi:4-(cytidine 5'-diphospho)-2-C-methyl-D-erythritol kinase [Marinicella meishanensis]|uniref:4-(cytidine 5'-diphospho)-2-C-methyl-D-erythritol kinase n=1 Tax=Marinicella meishanensis TaxID=2873263 RepID=UPI001CBBA25E|nr:4-(cytidine 5'-diphospho)-2-C-methyl-D-erythritol kinase [Marinicella sp. NBU2979]